MVQDHSGDWLPQSERESAGEKGEAEGKVSGEEAHISKGGKEDLSRSFFFFTLQEWVGRGPVYLGQTRPFIL